LPIIFANHRFVPGYTELLFFPLFSYFVSFSLFSSPYRCR
jgi:hypothetical protein